MKSLIKYVLLLGILLTGGSASKGSSLLTEPTGAYANVHSKTFILSSASRKEDHHNSDTILLCENEEDDEVSFKKRHGSSYHLVSICFERTPRNQFSQHKLAQPAQHPTADRYLLNQVFRI